MIPRYPYGSYESRALARVRIQEKVSQLKARLSVLLEYFGPLVSAHSSHPYPAAGLGKL